MSKVKSKDLHNIWEYWQDVACRPPSYAQPSMINIETHNTILQKSAFAEDVFTLDAMTEDGWLRTVGFRVNEEERDQILQHLNREGLDENYWRKPRATKVVSIHNAGYVSAKRNVNETAVDEVIASSRVQWGDSAESMLEHLENSVTTDADRDRSVLFIGPMAFSEQQRPRLLAALAKYIDGNRFTRDDDRAIVVGSAARKYAMNMRETDFEGYAKWLLPQQTTYLSERVELEFVKGVCWRLTFVPVQNHLEFPQLTDTLFQIVSQYTNSRVLLLKNFDVIALNAIVSVFVLDTLKGTTELVTAVWSQVQNANVIWFEELVFDRLKESAESISHHDSTLGASLEELIDGRCGLRTNA